MMSVNSIPLGSLPGTGKRRRQSPNVLCSALPGFVVFVWFDSSKVEVYRRSRWDRDAGYGDVFHREAGHERDRRIESDDLLDERPYLLGISAQPRP